jgi:hypothetical protein
VLEAYCWPLSVDAGAHVGVHLSTDAPGVAVRVARDGGNRREVFALSDVVAGHHETPDTASANGCGWPGAFEIPVGEDWPSGYYTVTVTAGGERADAYFVVRPHPDDPAPILLVLATATWNAYNDWGGPSLYTGGTRVSFERPLARGFLDKPTPARRKMQPEPDREGLWYFRWAEPLGLSVWSGGAGWATWEQGFVRWAESRGYRLDVAISQDLDERPAILDGHRLLLSVGHDEYWSWTMRDAVDAFTAKGGNAAILSGNTCFWQVRFDVDRRTMTCFKYRADDEDPVIGTPDERLLTGPWSDRRVGRPETSTTGLTFTRGGYSRYGLGVPRASGSYTVHRPDHWAFAGTDLRYGDALGLVDAIVAYEVDGCELTTGPEGLPVPTHADGAPDSLDVLATAPARLWEQTEQPSRYAHEPGELEHAAMSLFGDAWRDHVDRLANNHAVMGVFTTPGGGTVFNAGVTDWSCGLGDPTVARITRNVLDRLSAEGV